MAATVGKIQETTLKIAFSLHHFKEIFSYVIWTYFLGYCCDMAKVSSNQGSSDQGTPDQLKWLISWITLDLFGKKKKDLAFDDDIP